MFEYDETKSKANKEKHGIDFEEAQALWQNKQHAVFDSVYVNNEWRHLLVGLIGKLCYVAVLPCVKTISVLSALDDAEKMKRRYYENNISGRI